MKWRRAQEPEPSDARLPSWTADVPRREFTADELPAPLAARRTAQAAQEDVETLVARVLGEVEALPEDDPGTVLGGAAGPAASPVAPAPPDDDRGEVDDAFHVERLLAAFDDEDGAVAADEPARTPVGTDAGPSTPEDDALGAVTSEVAGRTPVFHVEHTREAVAEALLALETEERPLTADRAPSRDPEVDAPAAEVEVAPVGESPPADDGGTAQSRDAAAPPDDPDDPDGAAVRGWRRLRGRLTRPEPPAPTPAPAPQATTVRRVDAPGPAPARDTIRAPAAPPRPRASAPAAARDAAPPPVAPTPRPARSVRVESAPREALEEARRRATGAWQQPPPDGGAWGRVAERLDR